MRAMPSPDEKRRSLKKRERYSAFNTILVIIWVMDDPGKSVTLEVDKRWIRGG